MDVNPVIDRAIKASGGLGALAKAFGISPQAVDKWRRGGVPAERVLSLEEISGVPRTALRPDLYPAESKTPSDATRRKRA